MPTKASISCLCAAVALFVGAQLSTTAADVMRARGCGQIGSWNDAGMGQVGSRDPGIAASPQACP